MAWEDVYANFNVIISVLSRILSYSFALLSLLSAVAAISIASAMNTPDTFGAGKFMLLTALVVTGVPPIIISVKYRMHVTLILISIMHFSILLGSYYSMPDDI